MNCKLKISAYFLSLIILMPLTKAQEIPVTIEINNSNYEVERDGPSSGGHSSLGGPAGLISGVFGGVFRAIINSTSYSIDEISTDKLEEEIDSRELQTFLDKNPKYSEKIQQIHSLIKSERVGRLAESYKKVTGKDLELKIDLKLETGSIRRTDTCKVTTVGNLKDFPKLVENYKRLEVAKDRLFQMKEIEGLINDSEKKDLSNFNYTIKDLSLKKKAQSPELSTEISTEVGGGFLTSLESKYEQIEDNSIECSDFFENESLEDNGITEAIKIATNTAHKYNQKIENLLQEMKNFEVAKLEMLSHINRDYTPSFERQYQDNIVDINRKISPKYLTLPLVRGPIFETKIRFR